MNLRRLRCGGVGEGDCDIRPMSPRDSSANSGHSGAVARSLRSEGNLASVSRSREPTEESQRRTVVKIHGIHRTAPVGLAILALVSAACSATSHASSPTTQAARPAGPRSTTVSTAVVSHCGYLYTLQGPNGVLQIGGCAGSLSPKYVTQIRVRVGDDFQLASITEQDGTPDMQAPTSANPDVVKLVHTWNRGGDAQYRAITTGTATLRTATSVCNGGPIDTTRPQIPGRVPKRICPVVQVTVEPTP
jgi:hypothetical protein